MKSINNFGAIQSTEKLILDSKEKIEYYRTMMQELVSTLAFVYYLKKIFAYLILNWNFFVVFLLMNNSGSFIFAEGSLQKLLQLQT